MKRSKVTMDIQSIEFMPDKNGVKINDLTIKEILEPKELATP
ncbi:unannotated protein [freshwater metagenome]|uniref:Unannotated protein n=1 Tax=freshwater metagenome TaxID=449393 RepID=A0A6J6R801_9ZZZZ